YKFTGHERDTEASLSIDYMNARTYDPITGIFMQRDPLEDQFPGWTPYHYVHNNPLNLVDPTGMRPNVPGADGDVDEKRPKKAGVEVKGTGWGAVGANLMGRNMIAGTVASANDDKKSKKDDSSRRRWRDNNFEKGTNGSIFDERGRELLGHWLNGSGDDLIINGGPWGKYMDDNKLLTAQIMEVLSIDAADRELSGDVDLTFKPAIQNGYLTGYEMLHGSYSFNLSGHAVMNKNKGSVQLSVSGVKYLSSK
ncbi:MAG: RHS repeat-associated core domain-containing protein, partial [Balneolaceae bacterium]|nr:RHS repeat-associated core domain-containing protein [Balneolaceae bacterium]